MERIDLAVLPAEGAACDGDCYVVVDVLRATTTIAVLFAGGLRDLVAVDDIDEARRRARAEDRLLFGEVRGLRPEGFDHGNSPVEAGAVEVTGRRALLFTTNGTRALCAMPAGAAVFTGALANASAVAAAVADYARVVVVCAGTAEGRRFALEDFAAAAAIIRRLVRIAPRADLGDAAGLAMTTPGYADWIAPGLPQQTSRSTLHITGSQHGRYLTGIGLGGDVHFCAREDTAPAAPRVTARGPGWALLEDSGSQ